MKITRSYLKQLIKEELTNEVNVTTITPSKVLNSTKQEIEKLFKHAKENDIAEDELQAISNAAKTIKDPKKHLNFLTVVINALIADKGINNG